MSNKPNYVAEAPYQPGYEDAIVTESKPVLYGIYKSKPLSEEEILQAHADAGSKNIVQFARAIERMHGIK